MYAHSSTYAPVQAHTHTHTHTHTSTNRQITKDKHISISGTERQISLRSILVYLINTAEVPNHEYSVAPLNGNILAWNQYFF